MRPNPALDIEAAILELGVGEALVSLLDASGTPGITQRAWMLAPGSQIGPISTDERRALIANSVVAEVYERSEEHTSELQSLAYLVCRHLLEKKKVSYKVQRTINASLNAATSTRAVSSNPNFVTRQKIEIIFG